jgi:inhibitor of cysteine peptidase
MTIGCDRRARNLPQPPPSPGGIEPMPHTRFTGNPRYVAGLYQRILHQRILRALALIPLIAVLPNIAGCPECNLSQLGDTDPTTAQLVRFESQEAVLQYAADLQNARAASADCGLLENLTRFGFAAPTDAIALDDSGANESTDGSSAFTSTNAQEAGVGEADVFQSDGTYLFIGRGQELEIVQAAPAETLQVVSTLTRDWWISDLYLTGDTLIVIGYDYGYDSGSNDAPRTLQWPPYFYESKTMVAQYDVTDRSTPVLMGEITLDGSLATSRLADGRLVLILTQAPYLDTTQVPESFEQIAPQVTIDGVSTLLGDADTWYHPEDLDRLFTTVVVTLDAGNVESLLGSLTVLAGAGTIYMSPAALYITDTEYDTAESLRPFTAIHKITFDAQGIPQYAASGAVPGRLLNQFSLSEYEGVLRVASHIDDAQWFGWGIAVDVMAQSVLPEGDFNAVYLLDETDGGLEIVGRIENLAPGEDIYAARFMGPRGFVVTFETIDPLFVLDLSEPNNPLVLGELKVPGFSEYLHPIDENTLIGVGRSIETFPGGGITTDGIQLSLFDVSDWSEPKVIEQRQVGGSGSWTDVSYTHKAFAYLPETGVLAFPATVVTDASPFEFYAYEGQVLAFQVDPATGFTPLAELTTPTSQSYFWDLWRRAALIGDTLYAITSDGVRAVNLEATDTVFELLITESTTQ